MNNVATLDPVDELRAQVRGAVVRETDAGSEVREVFNAMQPSSAVTVRCTVTADVVAGVNYARDRGLPIAVPGGRRSIAGLSSIAGGVLLDLSPMGGVQVDPERRLAIVQSERCGQRGPRDAGLRARVRSPQVIGAGPASGRFTEANERS
jgi:FAD/FMN-containing dehydrogenase